MPALFATGNAYIVDSISDGETVLFLHDGSLSRTIRLSMTVYYHAHLARRGRNDRTELLLVRAKRGNVVTAVVATGFNPPNPARTMRLTA